MSKEFVRYRRLERRLWMARWMHEGAESIEEDAILDEMELAWADLSGSEQAILRAEAPRCWPGDMSSLPPQFADAPYASEPEAWPYEGFSSPFQAIVSTEAA